MTKEEVGGLVGNFYWDFTMQFFIKTDQGNFLWNCPDYLDNNRVSNKVVIKKTNLTFEEWKGCGEVRDRGRGFINLRCGDFDYVE